MSPAFRDDDLDRLRTVERDCAEMRVTQAQHGHILETQSAALERIEDMLGKLPERVGKLEDHQRTRQRRAKVVFTAIAAPLIVAAIVALASHSYQPKTLPAVDSISHATTEASK